MRSEREYRAALQLITSGVNDCEVSRRLGIPRGTVKTWRTSYFAAGGGRTTGWFGRRSTKCFRCEPVWVDEYAYAVLLGYYLGDGWIRDAARGVFQLRITCDLRYPNIINEVATHIVIVRGVETVGFATKVGCVDVNAYWKHWPCVFPQHGPGRKHERSIELAPWQRDIVERRPDALVRGLLLSDGNRHINSVVRRLPSGPRQCHYPRYIFTNASEDILRIFTDSIDLLGLHWTRMTSRDISVARRADVAFLDLFVGEKG